MGRHRADYMSHHRSTCANRYLKWLQQQGDLDDTPGTAHFKSAPKSLQLGSRSLSGHNTQPKNDDNPQNSRREDHAFHIVHEHIFDARLTGDALTSALQFFEETDDIEAYKEALVAAFRLRITFDCQVIRPSKTNRRFIFLAELASMIGEVDLASINTTGGLGMTILHLACVSDLADMLEPLFWRGASFDAFDESGLTALTYAVKSGDLDTVLVALALGADPTLGQPVASALSAERRDIMMALIQYGTDFNGSLVSAIDELDLDAVRFILSLELNPDLCSFDVVESMIDIISYRCCQDTDPCVHEQIALALLEYGVKIRPEEHFWFISHWAFSKASVQLLRATLKQVISPNVLNANDSDSGWTALHFAAEKSDKDSMHRKMTMASLLLEAGADINVRTRSGFTVLDLAAECDNKMLVKLLLDAGADITTPPNSKHSALTLAARRGNERVARMLIAAKADVNWQDEDGDSALILATEGGHVGTLRLLLDAGADINTRTRDGETALFIAVAYSYESIVRLLLDAGADVDGRTENDETALWLAVDSHKEEIVRQLLDAGASIDFRFLVEPRWTFVEIVLGKSEFRARAKLHLESYEDEDDGPRGWWTD
jgi:ankyrin repeat protein